MTNILVAWVHDLGDLLKCLFCEPPGSGPIDPSNPSVGQEKVLITNVFSVWRNQSTHSYLAYLISINMNTHDIKTHMTSYEGHHECIYLSI